MLTVTLAHALSGIDGGKQCSRRPFDVGEDVGETSIRHSSGRGVGQRVVDVAVVITTMPMPPAITSAMAMIARAAGRGRATASLRSAVTRRLGRRALRVRVRRRCGCR